MAQPQDPLAILTHLLTILQSPSSRHHTRYKPLFHHLATLTPSSPSPDPTPLLTPFILPQILSILSIPSPSLQPLYSLQQTSPPPSSPGVYLHLIRSRAYPPVHHVYIGQSTDLAYRIDRQHRNWRYRRDHASLHYKVLEASAFDAFVVVARVYGSQSCWSDADPAVRSLVLNVLEMWACLCFGGLVDRVVEAEYLPATTLRVDADGDEGRREGRMLRGLNVANPLDQGDGDGRRFVDFEGIVERSEDPAVKEYFQRRKIQEGGEWRSKATQTDDGMAEGDVGVEWRKLGFWSRVGRRDMLGAFAMGLTVPLFVVLLRARRVGVVQALLGISERWSRSWT